MSSSNKQTFEEFFNGLRDGELYHLDDLCTMYTDALQIERMDPYWFMMLPKIRSYFEVYRVKIGYTSYTALKKKDFKL